MTRGEADRRLMRTIVDFCVIWHDCHRACRRRKGCASPTVRCFDYNIERVRTYTQRLADWPRIDGPRELDELVEPVDDLLD